MTGDRPTVAVPGTEIRRVETALRASYGREMRCLAHYQQRANDPEYGKVFEKLALQEQEHCRQLLELIGTIHPTSL